jgi:hypothetical protein
MYIVGASKILIAFLLILGFWFPFVILPALGGLVMLMVGAVMMHLKIKDSVTRTLPAISLLLITLFLIFLIL